VKKFYFLFLFRGVVMVGGMGEKKMGGVFIMHQTHLDVTHGRLKEREGGGQWRPGYGERAEAERSTLLPTTASNGGLYFYDERERDFLFYFPFSFPPLS
jgi:hypothetical protein